MEKEFFFLILNEGVPVGFLVVAFDNLPSAPLELSLSEFEFKSLLEFDEKIPPLAVATLTGLFVLLSDPVELSLPSSDGSITGVGCFLFRPLAPPALPPAINV